MLEDEFILIRQWRLRLLSGAYRRMDYLVIPLGPFPVEWFGIEVKRGYEHFREFTAALAQAIEYRHAEVADPRIKGRYLGQRPPHVYVFPPIEGDGLYPGMRAGAVRLAGKFNVGVLVPYPVDAWRGEGFRFEMADDCLYGNGGWVTGLARNGYGTARKRGLG